VHLEDARVVAVDFVNVPSWVVARDVPATTIRGEVRVAVAGGGASYASLPAAQLGLPFTPECLGDLIALGREIKWALNDTEHAVHPTDPRLNGSYGTIWVDDMGDAAGYVHQRNVTVFADGEVDRSRCGSATCARLAVLAADGRLPAGTVLR
jgi:proline racemase